jgi:nucleoid DNA-binding protein
MSDSGDIVIDKSTCDILDAIASAETDDISEYLAIAGGDERSFLTFIKEMGYEEYPAIHHILDELHRATIRAQELSSDKKYTDETGTGSESKSTGNGKSYKSIINSADSIRLIAEQTGLTRKDVRNVFTSLSALIKRHLEPGGPGTFTIPGLVKIKSVSKPATRARKGVNPFTGERISFKAKPATNTIKVFPLKNLRENVENISQKKARKKLIKARKKLSR